MERQQVRAMLWNWGHALKIIATFEEELKDARLLIISAYNTLGAANNDGMPHGSCISDSVANAAFDAMDRSEQYRELMVHVQGEIDKRIQLKREVDAMIDELSGTEQLILRARYQKGKTWGAIAREFNYSETQAREIERKAVDKLKDRRF